MSEFAAAATCERDQREQTFSTRVGGHVVRIILAQPEGDPSGLVVPIFSGLASGPEIHRPVAEELVNYGHTTALVWQEGASEHGVQASKYVLQSLEQGSFHHQPLPLPDDRKIIVVGHSLGTRKAAKGLAQLHEAGDTEIDKVILQAAACLGGVNQRRAPLDAIISLQQEIRHISLSGVIKHRRVAVEGLKSILALRRELFRELDEAMHDSIEPDIARLQEVGVEFAAVDHPQDRLVSSEKNRATYRRLGIPYVEIADAALIGHDVGLYYPQQTARAIDEAISLIHTPSRAVA